MKHEDAMQNSLGVRGLKDDAAGKKLLDNYNGLKDRLITMVLLLFKKELIGQNLIQVH
jgi:hypothetical protein